MQTQTAPTTKSNGSVQSYKAKDQTIFSVLKTSDYNKFKFMSDNRVINMMHLRRLEQSFREHYLCSPIIVNEKHEIIDGQHRYKAAINTGLPVYYIVMPGYGLKEVQILNTNQANWKKIDYLHSYVKEGVKPYLEFQKFMDDFPDFDISSVEKLIRLKSSGSKSDTKNLNGTKSQMKYFEEGKLTIPNLKKSYEIGRKIMEFKPFFSEFSTPKFVTAVMPLIMRSKNYNHKEMIHKLSGPIKLKPCVDSTAYRELLETIYNWKRQKEKKVSFKYDL